METKIFFIEANYSRNTDIILVYSYEMDENIWIGKEENKKKIGRKY